MTVSRQGPAVIKPEAAGEKRRSVRVSSMLSRRSGAGNLTRVESEFVLFNRRKRALP